MLSVDELAIHILGVLQKNAGGRRVSYSEGQLTSIKAFEVLAESSSYVVPDPAFERKWAEAVQRLFLRNLIIEDPTQSSRDFVVLTHEGREEDTSKPIIGVYSADRFVTWIARTSGPLDPVVRQYLEESYRSASQGLWLSAAFMLGAASERAVYILAEAVADLRGEASERQKLDQCRTVRAVKDWIIDQIPTVKRAEPSSKKLFTDVEDKINTLFTTYRYQRNDVGHPRDEVLDVDPAETRALLQSFATYWKVVADVLMLRDVQQKR